MKPVWGVIHRHDRAGFEIHLFSDAPEQAIGEEYRRSAGDVFHDISGLSNAAAAERIEQTGVDVLVDLNGYSAMARLPLVAARPAPVIVGWFNLYATSGMEAYDWLIGDAVVIPPEEESFYCERIARVRGTYLAFEVGYATPEVTAPPCLQSRGKLAFGSLASQYKITAEVLAAWSAILRQAPGSTLILKNAGLEAEGMRRFVRAQFEREGVGADRVVLEGPAEHDEFLKSYGRIDVALDPFPYNGGTTTSEALWQGVPVICFRGDRWAARTSASIEVAAGLDGFVAADRAGYIALAVELARKPETPARLAELRSEMRDRLLASAASDTAGLARNLERIYREAVISSPR
jgi:predicted O-linked N-acetylglucosamine transferase (SPINDLY family)